MIIVADDPDRCAQRYGRFTGIALDGARLATSRGAIGVMAAERISAEFGFDPPPPAIAGYVLATSDLAAARACARRAGAPIAMDRGDAFAIAPATIGGLIVFAA